MLETGCESRALGEGIAYRWLITMSNPAVFWAL